MKHLLLACSFFLIFSIVQAQKTGPQIKVGTVVSYTANYNSTDYQDIITFTQLKDTIKMGWKVDGYGEGSYAIPQSSLETGTAMFKDVPKPGEITKLNGNETTFFISKAAFQNLIKKKTTDYNGDTYMISTSARPAFKPAGIELDMIYAVSTKGKNEIWVLNNPNFPLICKSVNSASGIDLTLNSIK